MKRGALSEYFEGVAVKYLSAVEASPESSNQHEFNGVKALHDLFGGDRITSSAHYIYLNEYTDAAERAEGFLTWYDARERHPTRSEYRLYFPSNPVTDLAAEGDLILFGKKTSGNILVLIAKSGSTAENQLLWLFDLEAPRQGILFKEVEDSQLGFVEQTVLECLDVEVTDTDDQYLEFMLERFGDSFPGTRVFSALARETCEEVSAVDDPDGALLIWLDHEERLFRCLERYIVAQQLEIGFKNDVDQFISFSLSVHNRRKSRAGHSFENHLERLFMDNSLSFDRGGTTENRSKPDFLFPGQEAYHREDFPDSLLTMLGVKTTCKDRWRQVLTEADKIRLKHLVTLEPGISEHQTAEMKSQNLQLVVPRALFPSFKEAQRQDIINVQIFIDHIKEKQASYET